MLVEAVVEAARHDGPATGRYTSPHSNQIHWQGEGESVLSRLTVDDEDLDRLLELEGATNDRLLGEAGLLPGISVHELVFGISYAHIVNAAFTHAHSMGSRFNLADRGAWYAAFALETSQAEVAFHKAQELQEINWQDEEVATYADYLADFRADFHDIRGESEFVEVPRSGQLSEFATLGATTAKRGFSWYCLSERSAQGWLLLGVFPTRTGD